MSNNGNHYFETLNRFKGELTEESLVQRMAECNAVLGELSKSASWKILINDTRALMKTLDDNWQHIPPESDKFESARIMKMACSHILDFPNKYLKELQHLEQELSKMQNPDEVIQKDSDNE